MELILIGGGKTAYFLARQFISRGHRLTLINNDPSDARWLAEELTALVILGDGSDPTILEEAGACRAEVVLALTSQDQDNLVACQLARQMYGVPRTIALVNDPDHEAIFIQLGVSVAFSATHLIASLIEQKVGMEEVINLIPAAQGRVNVTEVTLPQDAPAVGQSLQELKLPAGSLVAYIIRDEAVIVPRGDSQLQVADRLILIALPESYIDVLYILTGLKPA